MKRFRITACGLWNRPAVLLSMALALALLAAPLPSEGQQSAKVFRIGWLGDAF